MIALTIITLYTLVGIFKEIINKIIVRFFLLLLQASVIEKHIAFLYFKMSIYERVYIGLFQKELLKPTPEFA